MLETEEVDDDYFTPVAKTSLANIFKKGSDDKTQNESLKYSPPPLKPAKKQEDEHTKKTAEYIFSCIFDAYIWLDNVYTHKGKLGCAVVKLITEEVKISHILLYDSKKATISSVKITKELEVRVKGKDFISYYDCFGKYWCLYGTEDDIKKMMDILKTYNVDIKVSKESANVNPEAKDVKIQNMNADISVLDNIKTDTTDFNKINISSKSVASDTDSSINKKTKASILNRMANMGQSVLPPRNIFNEQSDSSDTNESDNHIVAFRSKPLKSGVKKNSIDKNIMISENQRKSDLSKKNIVSLRTQNTTENKAVVLGIDNQLMPLQSTSNFTNTCGNDLNLLITEQRINNSELRINMTRVTDKVDHILDKIHNIEIHKNDETVHFNTEILLKLLREYENKIKMYEEMLKNTNSNMLEQDCTKHKDETARNELLMLRNKVVELEICIKQKDDEICLLNNEVKHLKENNECISLKQNEEQHNKIIGLEKEILTRTEMFQNLTKEKDSLLEFVDDQIANKIQVIMNDTFQTVVANFDSNEVYTAETIKKVVATVIKKVTMESLRKLK